MSEKKVYVHAEAVQTVYGWGYNILADDKIYIKQEFIPGVPGKLGFKSREDALKVGNFIVKKISLNQSRSVSPSELDSLGISVK